MDQLSTHRYSSLLLKCSPNTYEWIQILRLSFQLMNVYNTIHQIALERKKKEKKNPYYTVDQVILRL